MYGRIRRMFGHCLVIAIWVNLICASKVQESKRIHVTLKNGRIEGKKMETIDKGKPYYSFQGIPYAKPPLGDLRFAAPQPPDKWTTVLDATEPANTCLEMFTEKGDEDCLYLNVFTPSLNKSLPVMLWIHGGAFIAVYGNYTLNGVDFFLLEDVVFITVHYRLGAFGFLSTNDNVIPGNFGLKDQVMAINWVHDNIKAFGGDPNKITLMGQSAGATSTAFLAMIPQLKGKIHGIIQQSGSSICPFSLSRFPRLGPYVLSTRLGIEQSIDSVKILESLRKIDAQSISNASSTTHIDVVYGTGSFQGMLFIPVLEPKTYNGALLTEMPYEQLKKGDFNKVSRLIGINSFEGVYIEEEYKNLNRYYSNYDEIISRYIPDDMNTRNDYVGHLIKKHYTNGTPFLSNITNAIHFASDDQFVRPILKDASLVSEHATTYLYQFSYEGKLGNPNRTMRGVSHGEELQYLFFDRNRETVSEQDKYVRRKLVRLWTNFAKYGNPTPVKEDLLDNQIWLPVNPDSDDINYMNIESKLIPDVNPHQKDVEFWDHLYATYGNPPFDTY